MCGALKTVEVVHEHVCMQNWSHIEVTNGKKRENFQDIHQD
jgi:hypothetical protein